MTARRGRSAGPRLRATHLDTRGRARMVDVGDKPLTPREASARGTIVMSAEAFAALRTGRLPKGDVGAVARLAGIGGAKRTAELIPLCHTVPLDHLSIDLELDPAACSVQVTAVARTRWSTGVEMEALTAVTTALLAIYDMAKAMDRGMTIGPVRLLSKSGGRSGTFAAASGPRSGRRSSRSRGRP